MSDRVIENAYIEIEFQIKPEEWKKITEAIKKLKVVMKSMGKDMDKTFSNASGALKSVSKNITSIKKNSGQLTTSLNKVNRSAERSATTFQRIFKSVRKVNTEVGEATRKTSKFADMAKRAGAAMVVLGAGKKGVDTFAGLEEQLIRAKRISGATDEEFKKLKLTVETLGKTTQFSAKDIAIAAKTLARSGLGANEIIATLPAVLDLSVATEFDSTNSASAITEAMAAFGEKDAGKVADMFTTATNKANISMGTLGADIKNVQASAGGLGISLNEIVSTIALMGNVGLKGGDAGTALNSFLTTMKQKADENKDLDFGKFKIKLTADDGELKNLDSIFKDISSKLQGMNKFEASQAITEVFNVRGEKAASTFAQMLKENNNALSDFMGLLDESKGSARQNAQDIEESTSGALARISASMESIFKSIGSIMTPVVYVLDKFAQILAIISDTLVGKVVLGIGMTTLSFIALVGTGSRVVGMFKDWGKITADLLPWISKLNLGLKWSAIWSKIMAIAQGALNAVMNMNPIALLILGFAALVGIGILVYKNWEDIKNKALELWTVITDFWATLDNNPFTKLIKNIIEFTNPIFWLVKGLKTVKKIWDYFRGRKMELDIESNELEKIDTEDLQKKIDYNTNIDDDNPGPNGNPYDGGGGYKPDFTIPQGSNTKEEKHYHEKKIVFNQGAIVIQGSGLNEYELEKIMKRVVSGEVEMNGAQMGVDMDD